MNADQANDTIDAARRLQRALYRAVKARATRRSLGNRGVVPGNADSGAVKGLGKPSAGKPHARFDEGGLETEPGLGPAEPAKRVRGQRRTIRPPRQPPTLPKPADLPVEQPMTFDFVVNMKTAQALGIAFPNEIMLQVTEVIQ